MVGAILRATGVSLVGSKISPRQRTFSARAPCSSASNFPGAF